MVDVLTYLSFDQKKPSGSVSLEEAMREINRDNYLSPESLEKLLSTLRAMPEGNAKQVFATGLLAFCASTATQIAEFGIIEGFGEPDSKGKFTRYNKEYVLSQEEVWILEQQLRTTYEPAIEELNSLTNQGKPLQ